MFLHRHKLRCSFYLVFVPTVEAKKFKSINKKNLKINFVVATLDGLWLPTIQNVLMFAQIM